MAPGPQLHCRRGRRSTTRGFPSRGCSRARTRSRTTCRAVGATRPTPRRCGRRSPRCSRRTSPSASPLVRPGQHDRRALARADAGGPGHRASRGRPTTSPRGSAIRRRSRSPTTCTTCRRASARAGSALLRAGGRMVVFVYNADDGGPREGLLDRRPLDGRAPAAARAARRGGLRRPEGVPGLPGLPEQRRRSTAGTSTVPDRANLNFASAPGDGAVAIVARVLEVGPALRQAALPGPRPGAVAAGHRSHAGVRRSVAARHHLQRVGRGHGGRELVRLPGPGAARRAVRLAPGRRVVRVPRRPARCARRPVSRCIAGRISPGGACQRRPRAGRSAWRGARRRLVVLSALAAAALGGCKFASPPTTAMPIRAAFYYPWFPRGVGPAGPEPVHELLADPRVLRHRRRDRARPRSPTCSTAASASGIASWFGQGSTHRRALAGADAGREGNRLRAGRRTTSPKGSPTRRRSRSPTTSTTCGRRTADGDSGLLYLSGKGMAVFVYNADDLTQAKGCDTVEPLEPGAPAAARPVRRERLRRPEGLPRLPDVPGHRRDRRLAPVRARRARTRTSPRRRATARTRSRPGYWKSGATYGTAPFLARDRARWQASIASMRASGAKWQLITTYNEWGEGTAIESSSGCRSAAPAGTYCDWSGGGTVSEPLADLHAVPPG